MAPATRSDVDWGDVRGRFRDYFRSKFHGRGEAVVEDLTSIATYKLLLAIDRGNVESIYGLLGSICMGVERDEIRRLRRWTARFGPMPENLDPPAPAIDDDEGDSREQLSWFVLEFFARGHAECHAIALEVAAGRSLKDFANAAGRSYGALRKQWERCRKRVEKEFLQRSKAGR